MKAARWGDYDHYLGPLTYGISDYRPWAVASYRSRMAHGETYKLSKDDAQTLLRKLKEDKRKRVEKKRELQHAE